MVIYRLFSVEWVNPGLQLSSWSPKMTDAEIEMSFECIPPGFSFSFLPLPMSFEGDETLDESRISAAISLLGILCSIVDVSSFIDLFTLLWLISLFAVVLF